MIRAKMTILLSDFHLLFATFKLQEGSHKIHKRAILATALHLIRERGEIYIFERFSELKPDELAETRALVRKYFPQVVQS